MKKFATIAAAFAMLGALSLPAHAVDHKLLLSIDDGLKTPTADNKLDGSVKFYFAGQSHPEVLQQFGPDDTHRKSNAFGKDSTAACNWALLSVLIAMQDHAKEVGANAVINITSYYEEKVMASDTQYECHTGVFSADVVLKGDFVNVGDK